jgi:hypothetical protein
MTPSLRVQFGKLGFKNGCAEKRGWPTPTAALRAAAIERLTWRVRAYHCLRCNQFHLTRRLFEPDTIGGLAAQR